MENTSCRAAERYLNLSTYCLANPTDYEECFPETTDATNITLGIICAINAIIGSCGNLSTLIVIPYAARCKKFDLHLSWDTNCFIINLALADFLYCFINLPLYCLSFFYKGWYWGEIACYLFVGFRHINAFAEWLSVSIIAVTRCLVVTNREVAIKILTSCKRKCMIGLIWIYACILEVPLCIPSLSGGKFGFNYKTGRCDFLPLNCYSINSKAIPLTIAYILPLVLISISYIIILRHVLMNGIYLKRNGTSDVKSSIEKREAKTTWAVFLICIFYILCSGPLVFETLFKTHYFDNYNLHLFFFGLYWCHFSFNYFVYVARNEQYQKALLFCLKKIPK